jgi:hypothetical protein
MGRGTHPNSIANLRPPKLGERRNPFGRSVGTAGASLREWLNAFSDGNLGGAELRKIALDEAEPWTKRAAARRALRTIEGGDLSDFDAYLSGAKTLVELRESGVNTEMVKKAKARVITTKAGDQIVERELELFDRSGDDFDRVANRTEGLPKTRVEATGTITVQAVRFIIPGLPSAN